MSIFWRVLLGFLLAMIATVAIVFFVSFRYVADRDARAAQVDRGLIAEQVEAAIKADGEPGFARWLREQELLPHWQTVYLLDRNQRDALDRKLPRQARELLRHANRRGRIGRFMRDQIITGVDGTEYLYFVGPTRPPAFGLLAMPGVHRNVLLLSLGVTTLICLLLSRVLTRPIRDMTETAEQLATGRLDARTGTLARRNDEIGTLARQFDSMASTLQTELNRRERLLLHVSHELRSPLTRIEIALELAERDPSSSREQLQRIAKESQAIEALTEQTMRLMRNSRPMLAEWDTIDLVALSERVAEDARYEAGASGTRIETHHAQRTLMVEADRDLLASALENVVRNALRFAPDASTIELNTRIQDGFAKIEVCDVGPGVDADKLEKIFQAFQTSDSGHHGLGLALVDQAMQAHHGSAQARNRESGGLEVTLSLPLQQPERAADHTS